MENSSGICYSGYNPGNKPDAVIIMDTNNGNTLAIEKAGGWTRDLRSAGHNQLIN